MGIFCKRSQLVINVQILNYIIKDSPSPLEPQFIRLFSRRDSIPDFLTKKTIYYQLTFDRYIIKIP